MANKPLKSELHHWWPRTLSNHWAAGDGMVSVMRPSGDIRRAPPGAFGAITNAHHMRRGGPWDSTFEPIFNQPDGEITDFVCWLSALDTPLSKITKPRIKRIVSQCLPDERHNQITRIIASLLARSPSIRHSIRLGTEYYRGRLGLADPIADKTLIAVNQQGLYDAYRNFMASGRWAVLFTDEREFIAGDGFLHNFPASREGLLSGRKLVIPLLPTATVVYMRPMQYPTEPRLVSMRLTSQEVETLNEIIQIYSQDFIFFRENEPRLIDSFKVAQHKMFTYHGHDWLDGLLDDLSQYNCWGPEGSARMSGDRPFSENLAGNRWFQTFLDQSDD